MKKYTYTAIIILSIGIAMAVIGAIFQDVNWTGTFNPANLADVLRTIGYIAAGLSGIVLVAFGVAHAIKNGDSK